MNPAGSTVVPGRLLPKLVVLLIGLSILAAVAAMVARPVLLLSTGRDARVRPLNALVMRHDDRATRSSGCQARPRITCPTH